MSMSSGVVTLEVRTHVPQPSGAEVLSCSAMFFSRAFVTVVYRDLRMAFSVNHARNDEGCRAKAAVSTILFRIHQNSTI